MRKILLSALFFGLIFSCSNNDNRSDSYSDDVILPVKIAETDDNTEASIKYNGAKIVEIINSEGSKMVYQYEGDNIVKITSHNEKGQIDMTEVLSYKNGKLMGNIVTEIDNVGAPNEKKQIGIFTYEWIDANHVTENQTSNTNTTPVITDYFFSNGNLTKQVVVYNSGSFSSKYEYNYSYDNKNNPMKNIKGMNALLDKDFGSNNLIKEETTNNTGGSISSSVTTYTNEYNSNNYLIKQTSKTTYTNNTPQTSVTKTYTYNK
jgi:hypothetical protein